MERLIVCTKFVYKPFTKSQYDAKVIEKGRR